MIALGVLLSVAAPHTVDKAQPVIRTAHDSPNEVATKAQLERLLGQYDLSRWLFTNEVLVDEKSIPHSHPVLTVHTRHLKQDDELVSTYVHEQLHWYFSAHQEDTAAAERNLMKLYPDIPIGYPEGGEDRESGYLHLLVCYEEGRADESIFGAERAKEIMDFWAGDHYRWIYRTVMRDGPKIEAVLKEHHLDNPQRA